MTTKKKSNQKEVFPSHFIIVDGRWEEYHNGVKIYMQKYDPNHVKFYS
jgi:hypothetical protein